MTESLRDVEVVSSCQARRETRLTINAASKPKGFDVIRFRLHNKQRKRIPHLQRDASRALIRPFKGNTDPFSVASVPITPVTHELLSLCHHLVLFRDYPLWAASMYESRVRDSQALAIRSALSDPAMLHCFLAAGYYIKSRFDNTNRINALKHISHVLEMVRKRLNVHDVGMQINYLMLFDSLAGNYETCELHWHALRAIFVSTAS